MQQNQVPSFQAFVKSAGPTPQKAMKPHVETRRRSSIVYSRNVTSLFSSPYNESSNGNEGAYFMEPPTYSNLGYSHSTPQLVQEHTQPPALLLPRTYSPACASSNAPSVSSSTSSYAQPQTYSPGRQTFVTPLIQQSRNVEVPPLQPYRTLPPPEAYAVHSYTTPFSDLASSPPDSPFIQSFEQHLDRSSPVQPEPILRHIPAESNWFSRDKALTSLGLDTSSIQQAEHKRKSNNNAVEHADLPHTSPISRDYAKFVQTSRAYSSSSTSTASADAEEESLSETPAIASEYHGFLSDQYRAAKDRQQSEDAAVKAEMRLVPAPLFFKRKAQHRRTASGNSVASKTFVASSGVAAAKPTKASSGAVLRMPNLTLNPFHKDRQASSGNGSAKTPPAKPSPRPPPTSSTPSANSSPRTPADR